MSVFKWEDFKNLADILSKGSSEASKRTAISRYYYASFSQSRKYLVDDLAKEEYGKRKNIHAKLIKFFSDNYYYEECLKIANDLKRLRNSRNKADYDIDFPTLNDYLVIDSKHKANNIFKNIKFLKDNKISF